MFVVSRKKTIILGAVSRASQVKLDFWGSPPQQYVCMVRGTRFSPPFKQCVFYVLADYAFDFYVLCNRYRRMAHLGCSFGTVVCQDGFLVFPG